MDLQEIIIQAKRIVIKAEESHISGYGNLNGILAEAREFTRNYAGEKSSFYKGLLEIRSPHYDSTVRSDVIQILNGFIRYIENGLLNGITIKRQAEIDVVSDILSQANQLLSDNKVHPAAPAMVIGATLEEFLRTWVEEDNLSIGAKKPSIEAYASTLREVELITKQDKKEIDTWGGLRNYAAHGEWEEVSNKEKIEIMLSGVNLFIRTHMKK